MDSRKYRMFYSKQKNNQQRFLNGPICPVYGFGAVIVISLLGRFNNVVIVFLLGMILTTILEYFTGFILETLFHAKWWDYSDRKFNIKGRVCLKMQYTLV